MLAQVAPDPELGRCCFVYHGLDCAAMMRRSEIKRKSPLLRGAGFLRTSRKKRPGHQPQYLAACRGEPCYLTLPGCRSYPDDPTVVPAHQNQGKGTGLKVPDQFTVPACHHCHTLYDQSGMGREYKRAAWDWAYTRWSQARAAKMGAA
jgi:hypothetical protein